MTKYTLERGLQPDRSDFIAKAVLGSFYLLIGLTAGFMLGLWYIEHWLVGVR